MKGLVTRSTGSWYTVQLAGDAGSVDCKVKGSFRLKGIRSTNPVAVGDHVEVELKDGGAVAYITDVKDRANYIIRRASNLSKQSHILAANVDQVLLFVTLREPETSTTFIDRFLASARAYRVPVTLLFNKVDILSPAERERRESLADLYESIGYETRSLSVLHKDEAMSLLPMLQGRVTLLSGHSGTGKSTLLNALLPAAEAKTAEVSAAHGTGMHTTTHSQLYALPAGGALIDVPGVKGFGTFDIEPREVASYFSEIFEIGKGCRFDSCTHTNEPGCAVLQALKEGHLAPSRYASYLSMMGDMDEDRYRPAY